MQCKNLNTGPRSKGKKLKTTVWGKLLICECGHTFNMRKWDRPDRLPGNAYQCYNSLRTGSYKSRLKKGLPVDGICQSPMVPEWRLQMMANLIFRKYLSEKDICMKIKSCKFNIDTASVEIFSPMVQFCPSTARMSRTRLPIRQPNGQNWTG